MSSDQLPSMVKCTTRHVRIFAACVDNNGVLVPVNDKLTLDVDPDNEFLWNDDALQQVQQRFREQVEAHAGRPLNDYNLRRIGTTLENLIRQLLQTGAIAYNPDGRVMNYSMGLPQQDTPQPR
ncbi:MAG: NAD(P)H-quinone oxidoreductase [Synechococcus sp. SB0662_bin_14]|nr:NAD(P)H-quinone oxidoreductase [Synechococcus sp. SB0662_bin_14]